MKVKVYFMIGDLDYYDIDYKNLFPNTVSFIEKMYSLGIVLRADDTISLSQGDLLELQKKDLFDYYKNKLGSLEDLYKCVAIHYGDNLLADWDTKILTKLDYDFSVFLQFELV